MPALGEFIGGFLVADGFEVTSRDRGRLTAQRKGVDGPARRIIWFADPDNGLQVDEEKLAAAFAAERDGLREADQVYFVTPSLNGLSTLFRQRASELGVGVRVPIQFFDTPYKTDGDAAFGTGRGGTAHSVFAEFLREHQDVLRNRVAQPFVELSSFGEQAGGFGAGVDLRDHLIEQIKAPPAGPEITIVIGNAGAGKSYLIASLFDALAKHFAAEKRALRLASRPILFLPEHIRDKQIRSMDGLLQAVAATDAAAATGPGLMRWLNANGLTLWMFDGLDEFFAGEADFIAALEQAVAGGGWSRILICARDSLLTTSTALRSFVDAHLGSGAVKLYELARWDRPSQRTLAWLKREQRLPREGESSPPSVARFMAMLDRSPALSELATLPYYCDLLLGLEPGTRREPRDEFELIATAVDGLIERESEKLSAGELGFDWDVLAGADAFMDTAELVQALGAETFSEAEQRLHLNHALREIGRERLVELIGILAHRMRMQDAYPNEAKGLAMAELREIAAAYFDVGLQPELEPRVLLALVQLAFFGPGAETGHIRFTHEIVADFLAGQHALRLLSDDPESADVLGQAVGIRRDLERSIAFRYLVREIGTDAKLAAAVRGHVAAGRVPAPYTENAALLAEALRGSRR